MADQESRPHPHSPRSRLLDELKSIKDLLDGDAEPSFDDIPVLSDVVEQGAPVPPAPPAAAGTPAFAAPASAPATTPAAAPKPVPPAPNLLNLDSIFEDELDLDAELGELEDMAFGDDDLDPDTIAVPAPAPSFQFPRFTLDVAISDDDDEPPRRNTPTPVSFAPAAAAPLSTTSLFPEPLAATPPSATSLSATPAPAGATPPAQPAPPMPGAPVQPKPRLRPDYSRELLIQELVDEFIPQIEEELRTRLSALDFEALRDLKDDK